MMPYPEIDLKTLREDEFSNGQPALLFRTDIKATEGAEFNPGNCIPVNMDQEVL